MNTKRVLVADDAREFLILISHLLKDQGYVVETASNGQQALETLKTFQPDLVILDIMMPGVHGIDVLRTIKTNPDTHRIGVIICSAKSYKPEQDLAMKHGAFGYITKPFDRETLLQMVNDFFSHPQPARERTPAASVDSQQAFLPKLDQSKPYVRFWGTRGSVPVSGNCFMRHGGNTPCLEINDGSTMLIIDAGTGIRELGIELMNHPPTPLHLFIGHTHWDHIQGFPFFTPIYRPGSTITIYGASGFGKDLKSVFSGQLDADYFPVQLQDLLGKIEFVQLSDNPIRIGTMSVWWEYVNHPGAAVGFKFALGESTIAYISDNEFLKGYLGPPDAGAVVSESLQPYRAVIDFVRNADVLITEAQYSNEEYAKKIGWGHTALSNACLLCKIAGVKRWIVTHHDPMHDDAFLQDKLLLTKQILESISYPIPVSHAHDGLTEYF